MSKTGAEYVASAEKRRLDKYGGAAIAGLLAVPAIPIAVMTMWEHQTIHPLFEQERDGIGGKPFKLRKFQTLPQSDKPLAPSNFLGGAFHPDAHDFDIALRQRGLDEIPQLLDVIRGDISLVGIRPLPHGCKEYYQSFVPAERFSEWDEISLLNRGLTGIGQLYGKQFPVHKEDVVNRQIELEIAAFHCASLKNDIRIIRATGNLLLRPDEMWLPHLDGIDALLETT
jgi:lipopolysaccharide/colanic/teichoic acid biosynthesis glycosyltransferase